MKNRIKYYTPIALILIMVLVGLTGCTFAKAPEVSQPATVPYYLKAEVDVKIKDSLDQSKVYAKTELDKEVATLNTKIAQGTTSTSYTKNEVDAKLTNFIANLSEADLTVLKSKLGITTNPGTSGYVAPTGVVSYQIVSPQSYYSLGSSSGNPVIQVKIINNTGQSRYVRPQFTLTTFDNSTIAGIGNSSDDGSSALTGVAYTIKTVSNSSGQSATVFMRSVASNTILYIANSGGVNGNGEYLVETGGQMTVYVQFLLTPTTAVLWKINVSGSDRPIS